MCEGTSSVAEWLGFWAFTAVAQVQFLVWELISHKQWVVEKKKKTVMRNMALSVSRGTEKAIILIKEITMDGESECLKCLEANDGEMRKKHSRCDMRA